MPIINLVYEAPEGWKPGANTIAYYPFHSDALDVTGNTTLSNTGTKQSVGYRFSGDTAINLSVQPLFMCYWVKKISQGQNDCSLGFIFDLGELSYPVGRDTSNSVVTFTSADYSIYYRYPIGVGLNEWVFIAYGYDGEKMIVSKNGNYNTLCNGRGYNWGGNDVKLIRYGWGASGVEADFGDVVLENRCRTAQEVLNYYNQTKAKYGL